VRARLALPEFADLVFIRSAALATRANRLAIGFGPANKFEGVMGFLVRHARDFR